MAAPNQAARDARHREQDRWLYEQTALHCVREGRPVSQHIRRALQDYAAQDHAAWLAAVME